MKVRLTEPAEANLERIDRWWRQSRPTAPSLFADELAHVLELLRTSPGAGERYKKLEGHAVRRTLLEKTNHYVYHFVEDEDDAVLVIAIWGTERRRGPRLRLR